MVALIDDHRDEHGRALYGIEGTDGRSRLLAVIPSDCRESIGDARSQVDFRVSVVLLALLFFCVHAGLIVLDANRDGEILCQALGVGIVSLLTAFVAYRRAVSSVATWGRWVRSTVDVFRHELGEKVGISELAEGDQPQGWQLLSQAMMYRDRRGIESLQALRVEMNSEAAKLRDEIRKLRGELSGRRWA